MRHYIKIIAAMIVWSTWGPMIRWLDLPPVVVLFYTSLIAGIVAPVVLKLRGDFPRGILSLEAWPVFAALVMASLTNNITYFYSLGHTTVSNAVFTHYLAPVLVAILAPLLIAEPLHRVTLVSLPISAAGMALIALSGGGLSTENGHTAGILAGAASGVAYAIVIIYSRRLSQMLLHHKAVVVLLWVTALVTAPFALFLDYHLDLRTMGLLLITGILHSTTAPLLYYSALRRVMAQHAAILGYMEPLSAIPLAFLLLGETPALMALAGGACILISGYLVVRRGGDGGSVPEP